jgi:aminoglycoside 2'-N-acetyltransferase I
MALVPTSGLSPDQVSAIRALLWAAFSDPDDAMTEADWEHALGGTHFLLTVDGVLVAHASVVERELHIGARAVRTGYVEAVATAPDWQGRGFGTRLMDRVNGYIRERFDLGALGTGVQGFYERLGWVVWRGPTQVRTETGPEPTPEEDGYIVVLPTPAIPRPDITEPLSCGWRPGDVW